MNMLFERVESLELHEVGRKLLPFGLFVVRGVSVGVRRNNAGQLLYLFAGSSYRRPDFKFFFIVLGVGQCIFGLSELLLLLFALGDCLDSVLYLLASHYQLSVVVPRQAADAFLTHIRLKLVRAVENAFAEILPVSGKRLLGPGTLFLRQISAEFPLFEIDVFTQRLAGGRGRTCHFVVAYLHNPSSLFVRFSDKPRVTEEIFAIFRQ